METQWRSRELLLSWTGVGYPPTWETREQDQQRWTPVSLSSWMVASGQELMFISIAHQMIQTPMSGIICHLKILASSGIYPIIKRLNIVEILEIQNYLIILAIWSNISIFSHNRSLLTWDIQMLAYPVDWLWEIRKGLLVSMVHLGNKRLIYLSLYIIWLNCGSFTVTISYTKCGPILIQGLESGNKVGCEHMLLLNFNPFLHLWEKHIFNVLKTFLIFPPDSPYLDSGQNMFWSTLKAFSWQPPLSQSFQFPAWRSPCIYWLNSQQRLHRQIDV